jgi:hypothetical protein
VLRIAGVDPFGRVAHREIRPGLESRFLLHYGDADLLGAAGIDGGFIDDDGFVGFVGFIGFVGFVGLMTFNVQGARFNAVRPCSDFG